MLDTCGGARPDQAVSLVGGSLTPRRSSLAPRHLLSRDLKSGLENEEKLPLILRGSHPGTGQRGM